MKDIPDPHTDDGSPSSAAADTVGRPAPEPARPNYAIELALVAALSLGKSAVYAVVDLADTLSRGPLDDAQAQLNTSQSDRPWFDLVYQLLGIGFALVPVALALYLMWREPAPGAGRSTADPAAGPPAAGTPTTAVGAIPAAAAAASATGWHGVARRIGLDLRRPGRDLLGAAVLFAVIGGGTLLVYAAGRALGLTAQIQTNNLGAHWWTVPVLLLAAVKNGALEEILLLGFGMDRLRRLRVSAWGIVLGLAVLRASYHLYQGFGPFVGNVAMGLIFGWLFLRGPAWLGRGRVMPFVLAHTLIDAVGFLAPALLA